MSSILLAHWHTKAQLIESIVVIKTGTFNVSVYCIVIVIRSRWPIQHKLH